MKTIAIMAAMPQEIRDIAENLDDARVVQYAGVDYVLGRRGRLQVVACHGGMGKANAASTTQVLITRFGAEAILFNGIAGNTSDAIGIGDVVVGTELVYHDAEDSMLAQSAPGTAVYPCDPALADAAATACEAVGCQYIRGRIATGDQFIGDPAVKADIQQRCAPACVEMEGAAVGQTALRNGIPFLVLRTMSDNSDQSVEALNSRTFEIESYIRNSSRIVLHVLDNLERDTA